MDYKSKYIKYKLKYLDLKKKMYGGMDVSQINSHLLSVVNETIFSDLYKKYLDSMTQRNFLEYQEDFKTHYLMNSLEHFQNNPELNKSQYILAETFGIENLNEFKKEIIKEKRLFNDITRSELCEANLPTTEGIIFMDGENGGKENYDPRNPDNT